MFFAAEKTNNPVAVGEITIAPHNSATQPIPIPLLDTNILTVELVGDNKTRWAGE